MLRVKLSSAGRSVVRSTGFSETIQTSAAEPPACMAIAAASAPLPMRAKPPGMIFQPSERAGGKDAQAHRSRCAACRSTQAGVVDSVTTSWPTSLAPSVSSQSAIEALAVSRRDEPSTDWPLSSKKGRRRIGRADNHLLDVVGDLLALRPAGRTTRWRCAAAAGPGRADAGRWSA